MRGWGSWVGAEWVPVPDETRPHRQDHTFCKTTQKVAQARGLHFRTDDRVQRQREAMVAKLLDVENSVLGGAPGPQSTG